MAEYKIKYVRKRDGRKTRFDINKPLQAVKESFGDLGLEPPVDLQADIEEYFGNYAPEGDGPVDIEVIQDEVEKFLMGQGWADVAKNYILYRKERDKARDRQSKLMKGIKEKLEAKNVQNQNANLDENTFSGRMGEATRVVTKEMALNEYMSKLSRENHENNEIYIHDLDSYVAGMHNCLTVPVDDLFANGFKVKQTDIRPAGSVATAFQLLAVIFQLQSLQQFGGVSAGHLDWTMVPYVRKSFMKYFKDGLKWCEGMSDEEIKKVISDIMRENLLKDNII